MASATALSFLSTAANPRIAGTNVWPMPADCARNSFHQSKSIPSCAATRLPPTWAAICRPSRCASGSAISTVATHPPTTIHGAFTTRRHPSLHAPPTPIDLPSVPSIPSVFVRLRSLRRLRTSSDEERPREKQILEPDHPRQRPFPAELIGLGRQCPAVVRVVD